MIVSGVEKRESIIVVNAKENNLKSITLVGQMKGTNDP